VLEGNYGSNDRYLNTWSNKYQGGQERRRNTSIKTTNRLVELPSFLQTPKVSSNHISGTLAEEQLLALLETEVMREVQEARRSGKIGVAVVDAVVDADAVAAVVEALDIAVVDDIVEYVHEKLLYCFLLHEEQA